MRLRSRVRADQLGFRTAEQAGVARRASRTMGCRVRAARNRRRELVSARPGRVAGANRSARRTAHSRGDRCGRRCFSSGRQPRPPGLLGRDGARHRRAQHSTLADNASVLTPMSASCRPTSFPGVPRVRTTCGTIAPSTTSSSPTRIVRRTSRTLRKALVPGGAVILATFAADGPATCSGLPVRRYSIDDLGEILGGTFDRLEARREEHITPRGSIQPFTWVAGRIRPR